MSNEHDDDNDDEIRESISCVTVVLNSECLCIPVGYTFAPGFRGGIVWRGAVVPGASSWRDAWDHAIAREKERRQRTGQPSAADKAAAMLAEVIRERDELRAKLEAERSTRRATDMQALYRERDGLLADLARANQERDYLRAKLEDERRAAFAAKTGRHELLVKLNRARQLPRYNATHFPDGLLAGMVASSAGEYVRWSDLAAVVGKDGEA